MKKGRKHLSLSQRIIIENGLRVGKKIREIARAQFAIITDTLNKGGQGFGRPRLPNTGHYA